MLDEAENPVAKTPRAGALRLDVLSAAFLLAVTACAVLPQVYSARPSPDELSWAKRSLVPWWFPEERISDRNKWTDEYKEIYTMCIHHPMVARIVYRAVLHSAGYRQPPSNSWKYGVSYDENFRLGNVLPDRERLVLRLTNAFFFAATVLVAYAAFVKILRRRNLAVLAVLPVVLEPTFRIDHKAVVPYVGADAVFIFLLVLFWLGWLIVRDRPVASVLTLGVLGGLAVSTKVNASFAIVGAMLYYLFCTKGFLRAVIPICIAVVAGTVFLALNPVYFGGGPDWARMVLRDTIALMLNLKAATTQTSWGTFTRMETLVGAFPYLPFIVPIVAVVWRARKAWWFGVTFAWGASIILCNLALIYMPQPRYAAPVRVAFFVLIMAAGLALWTEVRTAGPEGTGAAETCSERGRP